MLIALKLISSFLGTRTGKVVGVVLLVVGLLAVVFTARAVSKSKPAPPVISLLQKVQYMQQLEMVKYFSNHIMMLGDPDELQKLATRSAQDTVKAFDKMHDAHLEKVQAEMKLTVSVASLDTVQAMLEGFRTEIDSLTRLIAPFDALPSNPSKDRLVKEFDQRKEERVRDEFGKVIGNAWWEFKRVRGAVYKKKKLKNRAIKEGKGKLKNVYSTEKSKLLKELSDTESTLKQREKELRLKKIKKEANGLGEVFKEKKDDYAFATAEFESKKNIAKEAREAVLKANENSDPLTSTLNPKLLAVVPAITSSYIDLEKIKFSVIGDSVVEVIVDSIVIGKPLVIIDNALDFDIGSGAQIQTVQGGIYYEIFEQIRLATFRIEKEAIEKAMGNGMMKESCQGAVDYFKTMMLAFGYHVEVKFATSQCDCLNPKADEEELEEEKSGEKEPSKEDQTVADSAKIDTARNAARPNSPPANGGIKPPLVSPTPDQD